MTSGNNYGKAKIFLELDLDFHSTLPSVMLGLKVSPNDIIWFDQAFQRP